MASNMQARLTLSPFIINDSILKLFLSSKFLSPSFLDSISDIFPAKKVSSNLLQFSRLTYYRSNACPSDIHFEYFTFSTAAQ